MVGFGCHLCGDHALPSRNLARIFFLNSAALDCFEFGRRHRDRLRGHLFNAAAHGSVGGSQPSRRRSVGLPAVRAQPSPIQACHPLVGGAIWMNCFLAVDIRVSQVIQAELLCELVLVELWPIIFPTRFVYSLTLLHLTIVASRQFGTRHA